MRQRFNLNFGPCDSLPVLYRCWLQQFPAHLRLPLCRGGGKNYLQSGDAQSSWHCRSSSQGCSHLKAGDCLQSDWTVKSDPCSWLCSKPVPLMRGVAGHAWLAHPRSGETRSGRWTVHCLWFSLGGRWTDLTLTGENYLWNKAQQTTKGGRWGLYWWHKYLLSAHADTTLLRTAQTFPVMRSIRACTEKLRFRYYHKTLTLFCKEGEEAAKIGALFVARCQNQNKVQQKENRALLRTSHISRNQAPSTAEESWAPGFQGCSRRPLRSYAALCHVMAELRDLPSPRATCIERDLEQIHGLKRRRQPQHGRRKEGRSVLRAGVYFPCKERNGGGGAQRARCCGGRGLIWMKESFGVQTCHQILHCHETMS